MDSAAEHDDPKGEPLASVVYLGLGSNLGKREHALGEACRLLASFLARFACASLYESLPQEVTDQPLFLNTVARGETRLTPERLLAELHAIERDLGRDRTHERSKGPRAIDIDLLLYGNRMMQTERLTVPHPSITSRKFVLVPLLELDSTLREPGTGVPYEYHLRLLPPQGIYYFAPSGYSHGT